MAWYNASWTKRIPITNTGGSSGAQTAYQMKYAVTHESAMKSDFSDLRFTQLNGTTLLDAWLESKTDDTSAVVWVETDTPANTVDSDIYMYYGNSSAASDWDCQATMLDGDDFTGSALDATIWDSQNCNTTVTGSKLTISAFSGGNRYAGGVKGKIAISPTCVVEAKMKTLATGVHGMGGICETWDLAATCDHQHIGFMYNDRLYGWNKNDSSQSLLNLIGLTVVQEYKYKIVSNGTNIAYTYDGTAMTGSPQTSNLPNENMYLRIGGDNLHSGSTEVDWIFARKYVANPATYSFGSEESAAAGTHAFSPLYGPFRGPFGGF